MTPNLSKIINVLGRVVFAVSTIWSLYWIFYGLDFSDSFYYGCLFLYNDDVIIPSYTFVSTALAFLREGAKVVFADSMKRNPNLDAEAIEALITPRTKVIFPVHYAGVACDMD